MSTIGALELFVAISTVGWFHISKRLVLAAVLALKWALAHLCIVLRMFVIIILDIDINKELNNYKFG